MSNNKKKDIKTIKRDENGNSFIIQKIDKPDVFYMFTGSLKNGKPHFKRMNDSQLISHKLKKSKNIASSFLHGALQDVAFGWADEGEAFIRSLGKGGYKDHVKKVRERYDAHQKHNRWAYNIGNNVTLAIPVGGLAKGGLKLATKAGKVALAKANMGQIDDLAKIAHRKGVADFKPTTGNKVFQMSDATKIAKQNAALGAVSGAGYSDVKPTSGAVVGGVAGGAIGGALGLGKLKIGNHPLKTKLESVDGRIGKQIQTHVKVTPSELEAINRKNPGDTSAFNRLVLEKGILNNNPTVNELVERTNKLKKDTGETIGSYRNAMAGISKEDIKKLLGDGKNKEADVAFFREATNSPIQTRKHYGSNVDDFKESLEEAFTNSSKKTDGKTMNVDDLNLFLQKEMEKVTDAAGNPLKSKDNFVQGMQEFNSKIETPRAEQMNALDDFTKMKDDYSVLKILPDAVGAGRFRAKPSPDILKEATNAAAISTYHPPLGLTRMIRAGFNNVSNPRVNTEELASLLKNRSNLVSRMEAEEALKAATGLSKNELLKILYGVPGQSTRAIFKGKELLEH